MEKKQEEELKTEYKKVGGEIRSLSASIQRFGSKLLKLFSLTSSLQEKKKIEELRKQIMKS